MPLCGEARVFSDDAAVGILAIEGQAPLVFRVPGAYVDLSGQRLPDPRAGRWHTQVGAFDPNQGSLDADARDGFRWRLAIDRTMATNVIVHEFRIEYLNLVERWSALATAPRMLRRAG